MKRTGDDRGQTNQWERERLTESKWWHHSNIQMERRRIRNSISTKPFWRFFLFSSLFLSVCCINFHIECSLLEIYHPAWAIVLCAQIGAIFSCKYSSSNTINKCMRLTMSWNSGVCERINDDGNSSMWTNFNATEKCAKVLVPQEYRCAKLYKSFMTLLTSPSYALSLW